MMYEPIINNVTVERLRYVVLNINYLHAGRLDISADTAQGMPKFERAPLIIPQGK